MSQRSNTLWHHADFLKFWAGQTISGFGSRFTGLALPLIAITILDASPGQLGLLVTANGLPWLVFGLFVGVGVDRFRRRPILILTDLGRALLLGLVPVLWALDALRIEVLYVVAFGVGTLSMWFDTAYQSYLPTLVERSQLIDGNTKLGVSSSVADVAGPSLAGVVIQVLGAPIALAVDACSFMASAVFLGLIRRAEPSNLTATPGRNLLASAREGLAYLARHPLLRRLAATNASFMFCYGMVDTVFLLFLTRIIGLSPGRIGIMFGVGSIGGLIGAVIAAPVSHKLGVGPTIIGASLVRALGMAMIPLVIFAPSTVASIVIVVLYFTHQCGWSLWGVTQGSFRQALVPDQLQGRITSSFLLLVRGAPPLGALLAGGLGEWLGVQTTLGIAAPGLVLASAWLVLSPLWRLRHAPDHAHDV